MQLNLEIINDYLPGDYECRKLGATDKYLHLGRPLLYDADCEMEKDILYIARADSLPRFLPARSLSIICIGKPLRTEWLSGDCQILQITNKTNLIKVFNDIQKIYDYFDAWDMKLRDILEKNESFDIKEMLVTGSIVFENMITVCDHKLCVIFSSRFQVNQNGNTSCLLRDTPTPIGMDYSEKIKQVCQAERKITVPYLSSVLSDSTVFYCNNLYTYDHFTGCVSIGSDNRPFRDSDFPLFDYYFSYFRKAFHKYLQNLSQSKSEPSTAVRKLYEHQPLSTEEKQIFFLSNGESWVCFQLKPKPNKKPLPKDYMCAMLNNFLTDCVYATLYNNKIVGIIKVKKTKDYHSDINLQTFEDILRRMDYYGGLSNCFTDLSMLHEYSSQADYLTEQCLPNNNTNSLEFFEHHVLQYILDQCSNSYSVQSLYTNNLRALIYYDQKRNTDYVHTLDVYLKNEMSITKTAADLYLHRSSMLKRIDKLHQLLNTDLSNPDERLYYRICLAMMDSH